MNTGESPAGTGTALKAAGLSLSNEQKAKVPVDNSEKSGIIESNSETAQDDGVLKIDKKQLGKKLGKHAKDYGLTRAKRKTVRSLKRLYTISERIMIR